MADYALSLRSDACCVCGAAVRVLSATTAPLEPLEMLQLPAAAWIGMIDDSDGETGAIFCCSKDCLTRLVQETA